MELVFNLFVFILFTLLWLGFLWALLFNRGWLDSTWVWYRSQNMLFQLLLGLLLLPLVVGLWIWKTRWPLWLRLVLVLGLAWWNVFVFFPRPPLA